MTKVEFLYALSQRLTPLSKEALTKALEYYDEIISDRIEDGMGEEEAVAALGDVDTVAKEILCGQSAASSKKPKKSGKTSKAVPILLIAGSPLWLSLLIAAAAIVISLLAVLFSVVVSAAAVFISCAVASAAGIILIPFAFSASAVTGLMTLSLALMCGAVALAVLPATVYCAKGTVWLLKRLAKAVKRLFHKGEQL